MSLPAPLQNFWDDQTAIIEALYERGEISLAQSAQNIFAKSLILTSASFFETEIKDLVLRALSHRTNHDACVLSFCQRKGIDRQFHTWFNWDSNNANTFFAMFGDEIKKTSGELVKAENKFDRAIRDYIFIGRTRNELVHQNFLTYAFEETPEQTRERIKNAQNFLSLVELLLTPARGE